MKMKKILGTALLVVLAVMKTGLGAIPYDLKSIREKAHAAQTALKSLQEATQKYDKKPSNILKRVCLHCICKPTTTETRKLDAALTSKSNSKIQTTLGELTEQDDTILSSKLATLQLYIHTYSDEIESYKSKLSIFDDNTTLKPLAINLKTALSALIVALPIGVRPQLPPKPAGMDRSKSYPVAAKSAAHPLPRTASLPAPATTTATSGAAPMSATAIGVTAGNTIRLRTAYMNTVAAQQQY